MFTDIDTVPITDLRAYATALRGDIQNRDRTIADMADQIATLEAALACRDIDELTGLHNLRWLREWWDSLTVPSATVGAVAFIDLDGLKPINDTYGHRTGDRVLTHVAAVLLSSGVYAVRYGGDEFLVFIPSGWDPSMTMVGITDRIAADPVPTREGSITASVSYGICPVTDTDLHRMIGLADAAMYAAKRRRSGHRTR